MTQYVIVRKVLVIAVCGINLLLLITLYSVCRAYGTDARTTVIMCLIIQNLAHMVLLRSGRSRWQEVERPAPTE